VAQSGPLTIPLCGEFKNLLIIWSSVLFQGTVVMPIQVAGNLTTSCGLLYYSIGPARLKAMLQDVRAMFPKREQIELDVEKAGRNIASIHGS
jgi:hypothetical protein